MREDPVLLASSLISFLGFKFLSWFNLLINLACFLKNVNSIFNIQGADLNKLAQGGQLYSVWLTSSLR
jgi:hypothetical protein